MTPAQLVDAARRHRLANAGRTWRRSWRDDTRQIESAGPFGRAGLARDSMTSVTISPDQLPDDADALEAHHRGAGAATRSPPKPRSPSCAFSSPATGGPSSAARRRSWRARQTSSSWRSRRWRPTRRSGSQPPHRSSPPRSTQPSRTQKPARRALPDHLPREDDRPRRAVHLSDCGGALRRIGEDVTETLDYVPGRFKVIRHVREKLSCRACDTVVAAPAPDHADRPRSRRRWSPRPCRGLEVRRPPAALPAS